MTYLVGNSQVWLSCVSRYVSHRARLPVILSTCNPGPFAVSDVQQKKGVEEAGVRQGKPHIWMSRTKGQYL